MSYDEAFLFFFSYRIFHTDLRYSVSFDVGTFQLKIHSIDIRK